MKTELSDHLATWNDIPAEFKSGAILIGNGASRAVWEKFGYRSLLDVARKENKKFQLKKREEEIFKKLGSENFEIALQAINISIIINNLFSHETKKLEEAYETIKQSIIEALSNTHVLWKSVPPAILDAIRDDLVRYRTVFSTNYDLLTYWAIMRKNGDGFADYFWSKESSAFDITNTKVKGKKTRILYLHGALHLYRDNTGSTFKNKSKQGSSLLKDLADNLNQSKSPLFVSEGTSKDKLRAIYSSDYLSFCYNEFCGNKDHLCIFGHSLGDSDEHIAKGISASGVPVAVSIRPGSPEQIRKKKAEIIKLLPEKNIHFFNALTHPLGSSGLKIKTSS